MDQQCYNDLAEKCEKSLKMQNDYDEKLFSSATKTSVSLQPIVNEVENRMVTKQNLSQRSEPANDSDIDAIPQKVFQNISINIPNETYSNPNENIDDKSNFNEGVFFATPVNVTDEINNALVNQDLKEEHVTR